VSNTSLIVEIPLEKAVIESIRNFEKHIYIEIISEGFVSLKVSTNPLFDTESLNHIESIEVFPNINTVAYISNHHANLKSKFSHLYL
jgi:Ribonuclease G/E